MDVFYAVVRRFGKYASSVSDTESTTDSISESDKANTANGLLLSFFVGVMRAGCTHGAFVILSMRPWPIEYRYIFR